MHTPCHETDRDRQQIPQPSPGATTLDRVIGVIRKHQALHDHEIVRPSDTLAQALGVDSLDTVELFLVLEEQLDRDLRDIQNQARAQWRKLTVQGLADLLDAPPTHSAV